MAEKRFTSETQHGDLALYADLVEVGFNDRQFVLLFSQRVPGAEKPIPVSRIVVAPRTAGELTTILAGAVIRFEKEFNQRIAPPGVSIDLKEEKKGAAQA